MIYVIVKWRKWRLANECRLMAMKWVNWVIEFNQCIRLHPCAHRMERDAFEYTIHGTTCTSFFGWNWFGFYMLWLAATEINSLHLKSSKKARAIYTHIHTRKLLSSTSFYLPFLPCSSSSFFTHLCFSIFQFCHSIFVWRVHVYVCVLLIRKLHGNCQRVVWNSSSYVVCILRPNTYKLYVQPYNIQWNQLFITLPSKSFHGNLCLYALQAGRHDRDIACSAYGNIYFLSIHTYILHTQIYFGAADIVVNCETIYILHSTCSIRIPWTLNRDTEWIRETKGAREKKIERGVFREIRAQGDLMESVVMIVNSIVGIQSNSSSSRSSKSITAKKYVVSCLPFFLLLSVGMGGKNHASGGTT